MSWQLSIPEVSLKIWFGPYRGLAPEDRSEKGRSKPIEQTEFSIQCYKGKKRFGPVHRFPKRTSLAKVWRALIDYRL